MRRIRISLRVSSCIFFAFFLTAIIASASGQQPSRLERATAATPQTASAQEAMAERYAELPLSFEANQGQSDGQVRFLSRGTGYSFYLTKTGATLTFAPDAQGRENAFQMQLAGANGNARIHGVAELPGKSNYFFGSDSRHWFTGVPTYSKVAYENIYPGINLVYYGNQRQLEYDFVVSPGANPQQIRLSVSGAQKLAVDAEGNLVLHSSAGDVQLLAPKVYQQVHGRKQQISGQWNLLANNVAGFRLGAYDRTQALVIDPVLMYSSFLGGSQKNSLAKIAIDNAGNAYVAGYTTSGDFKTAPTPMATTFGNGTVSRGAFVAKIDPTGKSMLYSTYLSGNSDEEATGLAIDSSGNVYVAGTTHSTNFPTVNPVQAACATHNQAGTCSSAFLTKISASGSSLIFSTYLGGSGEESARGLAVDAKGSAYLLGVTSSPDFPVTAGAAQTKCAGSCQQNAFLAKFDPNGAAVNYATYLGGSGVDDVADLALDASGNVYVVGKTTSPDFPTVTPFQKSCTADSASSSGACLATAFVTKLKADGSAFAYSTYLGGSLGSQATDIAVDKLGSAYVTGSTQSPDFPVLNAYQKSCAADKVAGGCSVDAFLTKFSPTGKTLVYSTYVGGSGKDEAFGIAVDANRQAYLIGRTTSPDFPTVSPTQKALKGASDAFVARFDATGTKLNFSTYHGGSATESAAGIAVDGKGSIFLAGQTTSTDFPTNNAFQTSCAGTCASSFVTKMIAPQANSAPTITSAANAYFTVGTAGTFTVDVTATPNAIISAAPADLGLADASVTFTDNTNNTATITGTPLSGDGGSYPFTITATNGTAPDATQSFTLFINDNVQVTGAPGVTCDVGASCSSLYSASGFNPTPAMTVSGSLPAGVNLTDNGNSTGTLGGTAQPDSGGVYLVNVIATNPGGTTNTPVTVTTNEGAAVTSVNTATFTIGTLSTFTVKTRGFPKPALTETGSLPSNVTFTDNGDGTATITGTPVAGTAGSHVITIQATNTKGTGTQSFTLQVDAAPTTTALTLTAGNSPSTFNESLTFTAAVTGSGGTPTGTVTFKNGGTTLGTGTLNGSGQATFTTTTLTVGTHSITADYGGDSTFATSTSSALTHVVNKASTTTSAISSQNPSTFNQSVTFTATVVGANGNGSTPPSGTVTFFDNGVSIGTGALNSGSPDQAILTTTTLSVGTHPITATYTSGDGNYAASVASSPVSQVVNKAPTTTTVSSSQNPSNFNQSVTFTATVVGANGNGTTPPSGTVTFFDNGVSIGTGALNSGSPDRATLTTKTLSVGTHPITATYTSGDGNYVASAASAAVSQSVGQDGTTTVVTSTLNPSTFNVSVTFTATVTATNAATPTGTVTFKDGATTLGTASVNGSGQATFATSALAVGSHSITGAYSGDTNLAGSTSATLTQTVNKSPTATALTSSLNPSVVNNSVTFTATVTANPAATGVTGTVTFNDGGNAISGAVAINGSGVATFTTSSLGAATHSVTATYNGDTSYASSTSSAVSQVVDKGTTTTALASSLNPDTVNQSVTFTATLTPSTTGSIAPGGTVTFSDGSTTLGTGTVNGSLQATFTTSALAVGSHSITATYGGDSNFTGSSSSALGQTVNQTATTTVVGSSLNPSNINKSITFTATITPAVTGPFAPSGTVTFKDGSNTIGTGNVSPTNGQATFSSGALGVGSHTITAVYSGDTSFVTSTSSAVSQAVNQTGTTIALSAPVVGTDQNVTFTATVAPMITGAFTPGGTVTFFDSGTSIGTGTLNGSLQATFKTSTPLAAGSHPITASYAGDSNFTTSTSPAKQVVYTAVTGPPAVISGAPTSSIQLTNGATGGVSVTYSCLSLTGANISGAMTPSSPGEFTGTTNTTPPANVNVFCYFSSVSASAPNPVDLTLCTAPPSAPQGFPSCVTAGTPAISNPVHGFGQALLFYSPTAGLGLVFIGFSTSFWSTKRRKLVSKRSLRLLATWMTIALLLGLLVGCGGGFGGTVISPGAGPGSTPAGSYSLTVLGTGSDGSAQVYTVPFTVSAPQ